MFPNTQNHIFCFVKISEVLHVMLSVHPYLYKCDIFNSLVVITRNIITKYKVYFHYWQVGNNYCFVRLSLIQQYAICS